MTDFNVAIPVKLDAFVLNEDVCNGGKNDSKICPIQQPNYTWLRIQNFVLQNDVLAPVDIHNASPAFKNSRVYDLGSGTPMENRLGVYLHWMIPRPYRSGVAPDTPGVKKKNANDPPPAVPNFRSPPTRWLVLRLLEPNADTTKPPGKSPSVQAWIVESDIVRKIDDLDENCDVQVDVAPYIYSTAAAATKPQQMNIDEQAEVFIGRKSSAQDWNEPEDPGDRVRLNLLNSSNQLFPDYQPHNGNVFSILDRFEYQDGNETKYLTDAVAHYYVLGWHPDYDHKASDDPFTLGGKCHRTDRLKELAMKLQNQDQFQQWLDSPGDSRIICHGAMYNVEWHSDYSDDSQPAKPDATKRPRVRPADTFTDTLIEEMPIAVGTTPIDSLLAWVESHHEAELANDLFTIRQLLRAQVDSVAGQQAALDELQTYNFSRLSGGIHFSLPAAQDDPGKQPDSTAQEKFRALNDAQALLDLVLRTYKQRQWDTFSLWWKYVTDIDNKANPDPTYKVKADDLRIVREAFQKMKDEGPSRLPPYIQGLKTDLEALGLPPKSAVLPEYFQQRDPSLFIAGAESGWPADYLSDLRVRLDPQILGYEGPGDEYDSDSEDEVLEERDTKFGVRCLPSNLKPTARALIHEFISFIPGNTMDDQNADKHVPPLYHDQGNPDLTPPSTTGPWRDRWESTQPWFPLFIEWEADYYNIASGHWKFGEDTNRGKQGTRYMYSMADGVIVQNLVKDPADWDRRTISGRILLLPQPTFSLRAELEQLFKTTPKSVLDPILPEPERTNLLAEITNFPFLSAPLDGFANHLLTHAQGSHIKPNVRPSLPGNTSQTVVPLDEAWNLFENGERDTDFPMNQDDIADIGIESEVTPYGSLVQVQYSDGQGKPFCNPFKPVAHGQFHFTKINIIDKFGQCAPAIDQTPSLKGLPPIYPCISEYYQPENYRDSKGNEIANVVSPALDPKNNEWMQMLPIINQPARLIFNFVTQVDRPINDAYWRPIDDWENPIWGWLVVNYVDNGVQFFLPDGTFYREVRVAAPDAPVSAGMSAKWLPIDQEGSTSKNTVQLDALLQKFVGEGGQDYLQAFISMVVKATENTDIAPSAYAQFSNALVGKPLAMVNVGASLELAGPPKVNQSTIPLSDGQKEDSATKHAFPFKLGDKDRIHDGIVGYFQALSDFNDLQKNPGSELIVDTVYTDHLGEKSTAPFEPVDPNLNNLKPFFIDPIDSAPPYAVDGIEGVVDKFSQRRNSMLNPNVFGCILDPFVPLHIFSSILPIQPLKLATWTWESALKSMTTFFHFGPLVATSDVPGYDSNDKLRNGYDVDKPGALVASSLRLPTLKSTDWAWLQPYDQGVDQLESYMALSLNPTDPRPGFEKGPYTAIEGFLQRKTPVQQDPAKS
ncbi:MAG: hypothetical protein M1822_009967 [Bathelium mastoideum]|nr:MAG: hypothetical protein M1822_009967 [Bathelium mastoideum]